MDFKIKTSQFQDLVGKAIKGASNNKMLPITSFLQISLKNNVLRLTTTDSTNTLCVKQDKIEGQDFTVTVMAELFSKLVAKTTSDYITLQFDPQQTKLTFIGNGSYSIDIPLDEEGQPVCIPSFKFDTTAPIAATIKTAAIKNVIQYNKPVAATTLALPAITNYYFGKQVITADEFNMCINNIKLWDTTALISLPLLDLVALTSGESVTVQIDGNSVLFAGTDITVYGRLADGLSDYPVEAVDSFYNAQYKSSCKVPKAALLNVLDRLSLFINDFETDGVYLTFTKDGLVLEAPGSNAKELINYTSSEGFEPYTCYASIPSLRTQLSTYHEETVEIFYGDEIAIKMKEGNITSILALMEEPGSESEEEQTDEPAEEEVSGEEE